MRDLPKIRTKRRADGSVYYQIRIRGKSHHLGTHKDGARRRASELLREAYAKPPGSADEAPQLVAQLVERWKAWRREAAAEPWRVDAWVRYAGDVMLHELTPDHFDGLVAWLRRGYSIAPSPHRHGHTPARSAESYSANSIRDRVGVALRVCRWAVDRGWLTRAPRCPRLPAQTRRPRDVEPARLAAVLPTLPKMAECLLRFSAETGTRACEARFLRWEQVSVSTREARIPEHKTAYRTGRERVVFLSDTAIRSLPERQPDNPWVFRSRTGQPYTASGLRADLRRHAPGITPSQMRHTFAQHAANCGIGIDDLAGLLGHTDPRTTRFYMEIRADRLRKAAASLASPLRGTPQSGQAQPGEVSSPVKSSQDRRGKCATDRSRQGEPRESRRKRSAS